MIEEDALVHVRTVTALEGLDVMSIERELPDACNMEWKEGVKNRINGPTHLQRPSTTFSSLELLIGSWELDLPGKLRVGQVLALHS